MRIQSSRLFLAGVVALAAVSVHAQKDVKSGVRPQVLSLPTGPGSIEGLGESFEPQLNTGMGRYALPLAVPPGRAGFKPALALQYEAGGGNSPLGIGWRLSFKAVQRQTDKGLPQYNAPGSSRPDTFITESGEELVRVEGTNGSSVQIFRLKNESAFTRYTYRRSQDLWVCQESSGGVTYLGARGDGLDVAARVRHPALSSTYCWSVAESVDPNGNRILYTYQTHQAQIYCSRVEYGFTRSPTEPNRHTIEFSYGDRPDPIADYRPAFRLVTALRLTHVTVRSAGQFVRRYAIDYETNSTLSLLSRVTLYGSNGVDHLPPAEFTWCRPQVVESSDLQPVTGLDQAHLLMTGASPDTDRGAAEILDFNGDGLPDLYESRHDFSDPFVFDVLYQNTGAGTFERIELSAQQSLGLAVQSQNSFVQDVNGDGLPDLIAQQGSNPEDFVFRLNTVGQWATDDVPLIFPGFETAETVFKDPDIRALDLDFDKRIDTLRTWRTVGRSGQGVVCAAFFNNGDGSFRPISQKTEDIIRGLPIMFSESNGTLVLADMNGDRLQDLVLLRDDSNGGLAYWPANGYGKVDDSTGGYVMSGTPDFGGNPSQVRRLELQDLNRDGLADLYLVESGSIRIWLNRNGTAFDPPVEVVFGQSGAYDPAYTTYRVLDLDGDDFPDLLFDVSQRPTPDYFPSGFGYVRLFTGEGVNVIKSISNGIGQLTTLAYRSSTVDLLRDRAAGRPWPAPFPVPVPVIAQVDVFDGRLSTYSRTMTYHDGCYDGQEKEFRGFGLAEQRDISNDASAPDLIMAYRYDTGLTDEALKGKPLMIEARDAQGGVFYRESNVWQTVKLAEGVTGETRQVTFAYQSSRLRDVIEGSNGVPVRLKWDYAYDAFGNLTTAVEWGRLDAGWGDERITRANYTASFPAGQTNWILDKLVEQIVTDTNGVTVSGKRNYYDNLPLGAVAKGNLTRTEQWIADNDWTPSIRNDYDAFGNIIFNYDPLYDPVRPERGHFREIVYDPDWHAFPVREIIHTGATNPAVLSMSAAYDPGFGVVTSSADFNGFITAYGYDGFGRLTSMTKPPDTFHTVDYEYVLGRRLTNGTVINWVETRTRDAKGQEIAYAYDGVNRLLAE